MRFLEDEGLVTPERTAGGYRKFSTSDAARVDLVLRLQKEQFLPLAVIREKLKDLDKGKVPEELRPMVTRPEAVGLPFDEVETVALEDVPSSLGFPVSFVRELAEFGLVRIASGENGEELTHTDVADRPHVLGPAAVRRRRRATCACMPPSPSARRRCSGRSSCRPSGIAHPRRARSSSSRSPS